MSFTKEDAILQDLMNKIIFVSMEDGVITPDELAILKQVKLDIKSLRLAIDDATSKDGITKDDVEHLKQFRKNLLQNAYDISRSDRVITSDERNMINVLIQALMN